jgi:hypothetical protein
MLTAEQRDRIAHHIAKGWKLPDSLTVQLWEAYLDLEADAVAPHDERADRRIFHDHSYLRNGRESVIS